MKKPIYIFSDGKLERKQNTISFLNKENKRKYVPVETISELYIFGEIDLNKRILEFLTQNEILIHFFNHYGYYVGSFYPREHYNSGYLILKQAEHYLDMEKRMKLAKAFVKGAVENIKKVLSYYDRRGAELAHVIDAIDRMESLIDEQSLPEELMAIEGNIRDIYYGAFDEILNSEEGREILAKKLYERTKKRAISLAIKNIRR